MYSTKVEPKYNSNPNPRIGLIALASDFMIERDCEQNIGIYLNPQIRC